VYALHRCTCSARVRSSGCRTRTSSCHRSSASSRCPSTPLLFDINIPF
jgi:hypothetical protein